VCYFFCVCFFDFIVLVVLFGEGFWVCGWLVVGVVWCFVCVIVFWYFSVCFFLFCVCFVYVVGCLVEFIGCGCILFWYLLLMGSWVFWEGGFVLGFFFLGVFFG